MEERLTIQDVMQRVVRYEKTKPNPISYEIGYDVDGRVICRKTRNYTKVFCYDEHGRCYKTIDTKGIMITHTYDRIGRATCTNMYLNFKLYKEDHVMYKMLYDNNSKEILNRYSKIWEYRDNYSICHIISNDDHLLDKYYKLNGKRFYLHDYTTGYEEWNNDQNGFAFRRNSTDHIIFVNSGITQEEIDEINKMIKSDLKNSQSTTNPEEKTIELEATITFEFDATGLDPNFVDIEGLAIDSFRRELQSWLDNHEYDAEDFDIKIVGRKPE